MTETYVEHGARCFDKPGLVDHEFMMKDSCFACEM